MVAILASAFLAKASHFFAYLCTIKKTSRTFESAAWASYNMAFCHQAANRGSLDWGVVDTALYNEASAGRAKVIPRCRYCLTDTHSSQECMHTPLGGSTSRTDYLVAGRAGQALHRQSGQASRATSVNICRPFNSPGGSRCKFAHCRFAHLCMKCKHPHPASEYGEKRKQGNHPRSPRPYLGEPHRLGYGSCARNCA